MNPVGNHHNRGNDEIHVIVETDIKLKNLKM